jgi:lysophospholipase L1-like esterase
MNPRSAVLVAALIAVGCSTVAVKPDDPRVQYLGRYDWNSPAGPRFSWPASSIRFRFTGTAVYVRLLQTPDEQDERGVDFQNAYQVLVDGKPTRVITTTPVGQRYLLAENLSDGVHELELFKRTESLMGEGQLLGFELSPGGRLEQPPTRSQLRLLIIGDSSSTGYGNEGADETCHLSTATQNAYLSYGAIAAREVGAELMLIAWSGRGVYRNRFGGLVEPLPVLYERALASRPKSRWDSTKWQPQAVVIAVGANDLFLGHPIEESFHRAYRGLLAHLREQFPEAHLFCALQPTLSDTYPEGVQARTNLRRYLQTIVDDFRAKDPRVHFIEHPPITQEEGLGCDWHPSLKTHARMAKTLSEVLQREVAW